MKLERFFIPSPEAGAQLEIVAARPARPGPPPALLFNHGSTGDGRNVAVRRRTIAPAVVADWFTERGWMVLFPQRRGRGKSGGAYGEGLAADGSGYTCDIAIATLGFERAADDMEAVVRHLQSRPDVDQRRLVISGVSRGGILAIAYAGMRPNLFAGAINFNGGWLGRHCENHAIVNPALFARGATAGVPTLWLHGSRDQYYSIAHCRANFDRFRAAGGTGQFVAAPMGHALLFKPALWTDYVERYLRDIER